ncbi:MAG: tetratricopeptide repeat protein [Candidatus Omnitrophica bacterium]|nr:tetratricopeptide repeat protein [Candidatus Omnitrophota bacterium]MDD5574529.1 tetratricopeptide repeat protein [Candidatus Omnitrophota bacterium]
MSSETKKMAADYRDKGLRHQKSGDTETALIYFQKAVELDPSLAIAYNDAGVIYESKGWYDRAKQAYGRAIEIDPDLPSPYYNLGSIYEKEGDFDKAIYYYKQRVIVGDWNDEWTMKARQSLKGLGVDDPELKQDFLDEHLARLEASGDIKGEPKGNDLNPKRRKRDARLRLMRGKQLSSMGMYSEALKELGVAAVLDPKNKEITKALEEAQQKALFNN